MRITVQLAVQVDRTDGTMTTITESLNLDAGDNPRFESEGIVKAVNAAVLAFNRTRRNQKTEEGQ